MIHPDISKNNNNTPKKIAVVILTWNSRKHIADCLQSVTNQVDPGGEYTVVVVDNNSTDNTVPWIKEHFLDVVLLQNQVNIGYAAGNNVGLRWAYEHGYEYMVILNDDMKVRRDWLQQLVLRAEKSEDAGLVQPKILFMHEAFRINSIGNPLHPLGFSWSGGYKQLSSAYTDDRVITLASGAAVLVKRAVIDRIGYLDEKMFMYHEDVDYSWRARLAGFSIWLAADSKVYHDHTFSIGGKKFYYSERNRLVCYFSHYRLWTLFLLLPAFVITELAMVVYSIIMGWWKYKLQSYFGLCMMLPHIVQKRFQTAKIRVVSDRVIFSRMNYALDFEDVNTVLLRFLYNPILGVYFWVVRFFIRL